MELNLDTIGSLDTIGIIYRRILRVNVIATSSFDEKPITIKFTRRGYEDCGYITESERLTAYLAPVAMLLSMRQLEECVMNLW
ncbi:uncharacterized protein LOC131026466 isoform X2 [Salvia miltiorrhiza]|uniref:uncharacterized protein LOC130989538 isoform X2 n=1 Tax=Salvia miltiorrhiza TaxID=226208 RepID=UPI0025ABDFE2|nr:uncharacterized protein LOC130989538 isoform X2 [Salvia miltiorrhiza]XP_057769498.1 uncharacterized protein LOC130989538 isoform X2 [Salvia miltiorrhiza]XP_057812327.1 uncharacterized protein LOC131026466 isoform X2 [Salvia miltiorrhiza]